MQNTNEDYKKNSNENEQNKNPNRSDKTTHERGNEGGAGEGSARQDQQKAGGASAGDERRNQ